MIGSQSPSQTADRNGTRCRYLGHYSCSEASGLVRAHDTAIFLFALLFIVLPTHHSSWFRNFSCCWASCCSSVACAGGASPSPALVPVPSAVAVLAAPASATATTRRRRGCRGRWSDNVRDSKAQAPHPISHTASRGSHYSRKTTACRSLSSSCSQNGAVLPRMCLMAKLMLRLMRLGPCSDIPRSPSLKTVILAMVAFGGGTGRSASRTRPSRPLVRRRALGRISRPAAEGRRGDGTGGGA